MFGESRIFVKYRVIAKIRRENQFRWVVYPIIYKDSLPGGGHLTFEGVT